MFKMILTLLISSDKILFRAVLRAFEDNKSNVTKIMVFVIDMIEDIVGKGENADDQHFILFP